MKLEVESIAFVNVNEIIEFLEEDMRYAEVFKELHPEVKDDVDYILENECGIYNCYEYEERIENAINSPINEEMLNIIKRALDDNQVVVEVENYETNYSFMIITLEVRKNEERR